MAKIRKDEFGLYAKVGGHIARPKEPTRYEEGDTVTATHFRGSRSVGIGKIEGMRGAYDEYWKTWHEENLQYEPWPQYF